MPSMEKACPCLHQRQPCSGVPAPFVDIAQQQQLLFQLQQMQGQLDSVIVQDQGQQRPPQQPAASAPAGLSQADLTRYTPLNMPNTEAPATSATSLNVDAYVSMLLQRDFLQ
mmetsp:Transcript_26224/g.60767  ORF Transcript_26224/g.60767 Transcript_26224/m.60767 type:complete len:112 (-) Transcript_26224:169-504(-)